MAVLSEKARKILASKTFAHLALVDEAGRPHATPVWVDLDAQGKVFVNTAEGRVKARLLQPGTPFALSAVDPENPYEYVQVKGRVAARRTDGADHDIDALARKYLGTETYPFRQADETRVTVYLGVEHTTGA